MFTEFDTACMQGNFEKVASVLKDKTFSQCEMNTALRHAAYYTKPDVRHWDDLVDKLLEYGAIIEWDDRGQETILNAIKPDNSYVFKKLLNVCDGDVKQLDIIISLLKVKADTAWAVDLLETRKINTFHNADWRH